MHHTSDVDNLQTAADDRSGTDKDAGSYAKQMLSAVLPLQLRNPHTYSAANFLQILNIHTSIQKYMCCDTKTRHVTVMATKWVQVTGRN